MSSIIADPDSASHRLVLLNRDLRRGAALSSRCRENVDDFSDQLPTELASLLKSNDLSLVDHSVKLDYHYWVAGASNGAIPTTGD